MKMFEHEPETICWTCRRAVGRCSWSAGNFVPVDGWRAVQTRRVDTDRKRIIIISSYLVIECPEYLPDREGTK